MLKHTIKIPSNNQDSNVKLFFESKNNLAGLSEDITNLITDQTDGSINTGSDGEKLRFTPSLNYAMTAYFYKTATLSYVTNVAPNEFTSGDITSDSFKNSFYIYKIFDSPEENNQNLLHTGYINGFNFVNGYTSLYNWDTNNFEYGDIHIPNSFLVSLTGDTFFAYMKLNFYSAKSGVVYPFSGITASNTESDLYNKMTFIVSTKRYTVSTFIFKEVKNTAYVNQVNDSVDSLSLEKPTFPSGTTFTTDGNYVTL